MSIFALGLPGQKSRFAMLAEDQDMVAGQLLPGEVFFELDDMVDILISEDGKTFTPILVDMEFEQSRIRHVRTSLLAGCDWTQNLDIQLSEEKRLEWAAYRQALRDLPEEQSGLVFEDVVWPNPPQ